MTDSVIEDPVIQTVSLGPQWPTADPFLFCAHHDDAYPPGNEHFGPAASLDGRDLGSDFAGLDGWRMYHGQVVPGFPQHPHRGFETVTFVRRGLIDHSDSLGAAARFGRGDVQWVTTGSGIVHSEMFPLLDRDGPNPVELFQIWLNLPAADKMADPYFTMFWSHDIPRVVFDDAGRRVEIEVVTGSLDGAEPPSPPPSSWAARPEADVAIWAVRMDAGATWTLPAARSAETVRTLYGFVGEGLDIGGHPIGPDTGAVVRTDVPVELTAGDTDVELLVLQGRPIGEPVARYGPFVSNDRAGIEQALADYRRTGFGGWPWPADDPVHGRDESRFAHHADGRVERIESTTGG
ncbi:MAG TPA: pirin family protein [Acidimicrobiia bacterium]|nr:pirin family protein [Acidimicrobiia bacterium]